ncbi:MAG: hypothetical protein MR420_09695 [Spirochaetia bacterium]|nr:hypothetical protein [Spirochaetia bacterium]
MNMKNCKILLLSLVALFLTPVCFYGQGTDGSGKQVASQQTAGESMNQTQTPKKEKKASKKQNFAGWIDTSKKNIDTTVGIVELKTKNKLGSFNILVKNDENASIPVINNGNEFTTSAFYLRVNKNIYKLCSNLKTKVVTRTTNSGMEIAYQIDDVGLVVINFECMQSLENGDFDLLKVNAEITNKGKKSAEFSLKAIFDTILGERNEYHFYIRNQVPILSETYFRYPRIEQSIISKNIYASMEFLLNGYDITTPDLVALSNYATLDTSTWEPDMLSYRAFDTVTSYNNSAVGILWPSKRLKKDESMNVTFYIALAADGREPNGNAFIDRMTKPEEDEIVEADNDVKEVSAEKTEEIPVAEKNTETPAVSEPKIKDVPNVKFDIASLSKDQFTPEYIQGLLNRIQSLEASDPALNREELLLLNAELDAILEALR